jgi:hypothetical protein
MNILIPKAIAKSGAIVKVTIVVVCPAVSVMEV